MILKIFKLDISKYLIVSCLVSIIVFLTTFFIGMALADGTIWTSYSLLNLSFFSSKIISMGVPLFITYFIRRLLLGVKPGKEVQI